MSEPEPLSNHPSSSSAASNSTQPQPSAPTQAQIFDALTRYPFDADAEYQAGLSAILGHPERRATAEELADKTELVRHAECFYFERKYNLPSPIDATAYSAWLSQRSASQQQQPSSQLPSDAAILEAPPEVQLTTAPAPAPTTVPAPPSQPVPATAAAAADQQPPPYPTSFAAIVDLITRNIPVPGIEEIPPTVLEPGSSKVDKTPRRRKPWEKDDHESVDIGGGQQESQSVSATSADTGNTASRPVGNDLENQETRGSSGSGGLSETSADVTTNQDTASSGIDINGHRETGTGVVNILKPNAVPDSGLLGKD